METKHLASLGARPIPRSDFVAALASCIDEGDAPGYWPRDAIRNFFRTTVTSGPLGSLS